MIYSTLPAQASPPRPHPGVIQKLNTKMPRNQKLPGLYFLQSPALVPERRCQTVLICPSLRRSKRRQQEEPPPRPGLNPREEPELYRAAIGSGQLRFPAREQCDLLFTHPNLARRSPAGAAGRSPRPHTPRCSSCRVLQGQEHPTRSLLTASAAQPGDASPAAPALKASAMPFPASRSLISALFPP